jgi:hypothetical protein
LLSFSTDGSEDDDAEATTDATAITVYGTGATTITVYGNGSGAVITQQSPSEFPPAAGIDGTLRNNLLTEAGIENVGDTGKIHLLAESMSAF